MPGRGRRIGAPAKDPEKPQQRGAGEGTSSSPVRLASHSYNTEPQSHFIEEELHC